MAREQEPSEEAAASCCGWKKSIGQSERRKKKPVGTDPPLLVLLPVHHDHLALGERQLVRVVGHAVVDGFHPLRSLFLENEALRFGKRELMNP